MATIKKLYFANGTDVTTPSDLSFESSTNHLEQYADDAAYVTANGAAQEGDIYLNTTLEAPRAYLGGAWRTALMANDAADATKQVTVNLTGAAAAKTQTLTFVGTDNRSYTFPDYSGRIAINTGTETAPVLFSGATGNLDIGNASGTVRIVGNLEVQGTTTTLNTQTVQVEDNNIIVNYGGSDITAQGSGLQVDRTGTDGSLVYDSTAATRWKSGDLGSEVEIVDKSTAQALTNKTIDGSLNTISNLTSAMVTGTIAPSKGGSGVANNDAATLTRSGNHAVTLTTTNTTSVTLPESGTLATLAGTEAITNKDIDGGTASNTSRWTIPKATKTTLDALTRKEATISYGTDTKKLYVDYDSTLNEIGGGAGGAAGRNYLSAWYTSLNPVGTVVTGLTSSGNRTSSQTSWGASATADLTIANNATVPLRETGDFLIDSSTSTSGAFVESPMFNLDLVDLSKAVVLSFDITGNAADGNYDVVVVRYNSSGTYQETISVAGNASSGTPASAKLPTGTTTFKGFFVSSNTQTDFYSVRIRKTAAVNDDFQIDSIFVGPQSLSAGVAMTATAQHSPTIGGLGTGGTVSASTDFFWYRVGPNMIAWGSFLKDASAGTGGADVTMTMPSGVTIDPNYLTESGAVQSQSNRLGSWNIRNASGKYGSVNPASTTSLRFSRQDTATSDLNGSDIGANAVLAFGPLVIPISEWTSNVTMADRAVEIYASNSGIGGGNANTDYTVGSVEGHSGSQFAAVNSTDSTNGFVTRYAVNFSQPILQTTLPIIEFTEDSGATWSQTSRVTFNSKINANNAVYGMWIEPRNSASVWVVFGNSGRQAGTTYGSTGISWAGIAGNNQYRWRLRAVNGGAAVGFPIAPANITLINSTDNYSGNTKLGLMSYSHGTTYNGGIAPTVTLTAGGGTLTSVTKAVFVPYQMADGSWRIKFNFRVVLSSTARTTIGLSVNGITFPSLDQAISGNNAGAAAVTYAVASSSGSQLTMGFSSATTDTAIYSGDVELASKPTWAY